MKPWRAVLVLLFSSALAQATLASVGPQHGQPALLAIGSESVDLTQALSPMTPLAGHPFSWPVRGKPPASVILADQGMQSPLSGAQPDAGSDPLADQGGVDREERQVGTGSEAIRSGTPPERGFGFVIPKNTCESGSALQEFQSDY